jgi:hypothetical protein
MNTADECGDIGFAHYMVSVFWPLFWITGGFSYFVKLAGFSLKSMFSCINLIYLGFRLAGGKVIPKDKKPKPQISKIRQTSNGDSVKSSRAISENPALDSIDLEAMQEAEALCSTLREQELENG